MERTEDFGRCWGCGYDLRGSTGRICPECGREFNPEDPATRDRGIHSLGRLGRFWMRPLGRWTLVLAGLATVILLAITGWPAWSRFSFVEMDYYFQPAHVRRADYVEQVMKLRWGTLTGAAYVFTSITWGLLILWVTLRAASRRLVFWRRAVPASDRGGNWKRVVALAGLLVVTVAWLGFGWVNRFAGHFAERQLAAKPDPVAALSGATMPIPVILRRGVPSLGPVDWERIENFGAAKLWRPRNRSAWLALIVANEHTRTFAMVRLLIDQERDPQVRLTMLRLLAVGRQAADLERWIKLLDSSDVKERAVAADAIAFLLGAPMFEPNAGLGWTNGTCIIASDPPIDVASIVGTTASVTEGSVSVARERLWAIATQDATAEDRDAARRALVMLPGTNYQLRVAEWGVWLAKSAEMKIGKKIQEEIPGFVHRVGNTTASMRERMHMPQWLTPVTKPIVHVTADREMWLDFAASITGGRPWFVYPMPDDFTLDIPRDVFAGSYSIGGSVAPRNLSRLDPPGMKPLLDLRSGPQWLLPHGASSVDSDPEILASWGVRWESLRVTPELRTGMELKEVPPAKDFAWWQALRKVPSSYVSNRGETERFLYYDGPTLLGVPVEVVLEKGVLKFKHWPDTKDHYLNFHFRWERSASGLYIEVKAGRATAEGIRSDWHTRDIPAPQTFVDARAMVAARLLKAGLTPAEAHGLLESWDQEFFKTDGKRFLQFLRPDEYDALCPLTVRPNPTERVRVGIVWTEL